MSARNIDNQRPTPYHDLNRVLREMVDAVRALLDENFIGAYLQGSFAIGDFDLHSDVDFIVVMQQDLTQAQVDSLQAIHERIYNLNSRWAKHLEGSYFPLEIIRTAPQPGDTLWYLDNGARGLIRSDHCNTLLVRYVVREQGITLAGVPPKTLIGPIAADVLRHEIYTTLNAWGQTILQNTEIINNRFYQPYAVLNYCRMLHDLSRGQAGSKLAGAEWIIYQGLAKEWDGLIERSWARRSNPANWVGLPADPDEVEATIKFIGHIMSLSHQFMQAQMEHAS